MITQSNTLSGKRSAAKAVNWDELYGELLPKVYRYFCYRVGEGQVAEDLTATTFEKAWRKRRRYRKDAGAFSTWIFTIARNVATDHFRTTHPAAPLDDGDIVIDPASQPEEQVSKRETFARLVMHISQLTARQQEILALKYGAGLANREIATAMGLTASNVGVILSRTVSKLRKVMEKDNE